MVIHYNDFYFVWPIYILSHNTLHMKNYQLCKERKTLGHRKKKDPGLGLTSYRKMHFNVLLPTRSEQHEPAGRGVLGY